jgi:tripartite-type tricarboxylate transporter receptor subunit TctC
MTTRRILLATPALLALPAAARAQGAFPTKPVRLVVPWAPGGATSNIARIVGDAMTPHLGQSIVLDHRPGAGGAIGSENVAKSPADGYSILIAGAGTFYRPIVERDVPFDPARDFGFVGPIGDGPFALVARNGLPATLEAFIAHARARPGQLNVASSGQGSTSHLTAEAFNVAAGIQATHVPYRGAAPAMADLVGGRVDYYFDAFSTVLENVRGGRIQALGVTTPVRAAQAPEIPTLTEAGLPGFAIAPWWGADRAGRDAGCRGRAPVGRARPRAGAAGGGGCAGRAGLPRLLPRPHRLRWLRPGGGREMDPRDRGCGPQDPLIRRNPLP